MTCTYMCTTYHRHILIGDTWYLLIPGSYDLRNRSWLSSARYKRFYKSQRSYHVNFTNSNLKKKKQNMRPVLYVTGLLPWTPRTGQRRRWSYRSLELFLCILGRSHGSRRAWPTELMEKMCLRPPSFFLRSHRRGTPCYGLYPWARLLPRSPPVGVHDLSPRLGSPIVPKQRWIASGMLVQWEYAMQVG